MVKCIGYHYMYFITIKGWCIRKPSKMTITIRGSQFNADYQGSYNQNREPVCLVVWSLKIRFIIPRCTLIYYLEYLYVYD